MPSLGSALLALAFLAAVSAAAIALSGRHGNRRRVDLSRRLFQTPTRFYKTGVVFLAYLNGHQDHFRMMSGQEGARSIVHLSDLFRLADEARLLCDPELAVERMQRTLALSGVA